MLEIICKVVFHQRMRDEFGNILRHLKDAFETDGSGVMICIFCRNEIRKLFSHVKEGHDRTGADIAPSRSRLETITLVHGHCQARKYITF